MDTPTEIAAAIIDQMSPGEPCADCGEPVWHNSDGEDCWYHVDPAIICFLANGKAPPMGIVAVAS